MKIDPYNHKEDYNEWKDRVKDGIPEIGEYNSNLLIQYLKDMEIGINVGNNAKKGARSFIHINSLRDRLIPFMKRVKEIYGLEKITDLSEEQIHLLFTNMSNGVLVKSNGKPYKAVVDYIKIFKAFWHWYQRVSKKKGIEVLDITTDLDTKQEKPDWVYLTEEEVKRLAGNARRDYSVLIWFLYDSGIRAPTELVNIKVSDFYNDFKELQIREETSKTFGRRIKLMLCSQLISERVKELNLKADDYVFPINHFTVNRYFKRLAKRLFGDKKSPAGQNYSELTMYDFRHNSCCYWLPRYKSESALKYRFGWKKSDKIHYYSELLGMKDTISEEDLLIDVTKTEIEKQLEKSEKEKELMRDEITTLRMQIAQIGELTTQLATQMGASGGISNRRQLQTPIKN